VKNHKDNKGRPVRSYVIRSGRITISQRQAIGRLWNDHVIPFSGGLLDLGEIFQNSLPITVEIGFGMGSSLIDMACKRPDTNFLGIEVHKPGIGKVLKCIEKLGIENLKLICHDAAEVFNNAFEDETLDRVLVLFPDPWPKKRHAKRRIIQPEFVSKVSEKLKNNGCIHLATDWSPYAEHMIEVLDKIPSLSNAIAPKVFWENPERPETKFEKRGKKLGHRIWDLLYQKE
jgi:tRNA (guanine-N7-)-methyltransferase